MPKCRAKGELRIGESVRGQRRTLEEGEKGETWQMRGKERPLRSLMADEGSDGKVP